MDAVSLKLARNYTNEKLNSLPSNAPTKTVSFDGGIYSVGNDVVNGQVSDVVLKGNTYTNILGSDGDFEIDTNSDGRADGWNAAGTLTSVSLVTDKVYGAKGQQYTVSTSGAGVAHLVSFVSGRKYYIVGFIKSANASIRVNAVSTFKARTTYATNVNAFTKVSMIYLSDGTEDRIVVASEISSDNQITVDGVMVIDLTAIGLDTLTLAQCDAIFSFINGTKSTNSVRVRSVNEDETKESIAYVNLPQGEELRSLPNGVKDEVRVSGGNSEVFKRTKEKILQASDIQTSGQYVDNGIVARYFVVEPSDMKDRGIAGLNNLTVGNIPVGLFEDRTTTNIIGKFYTDTINNIVFGFETGTTLEQARTKLSGLSLTYQLATPIETKLPAQAPLQVFENGTVYVEPIGDPAESTVPSVEMTIPTGTSNKFGVATHDYGGAAADWELTNSESKCFLLAVSSAGGAANIIAPNRPGTMYAISNASGHAITIKKSGGNGVDVNTGKTVLVIHNGTDYTALTAEL